MKIKRSEIKDIILQELETVDEGFIDSIMSKFRSEPEPEPEPEEEEEEEEPKRRPYDHNHPDHPDHPDNIRARRRRRQSAADSKAYWSRTTDDIYGKRHSSRNKESNRYQHYRENTSVKITKKQLKQIVIEEINEAWRDKPYNQGTRDKEDVYIKRGGRRTEPETDEERKYRRAKEAREDERRREAGLPPEKSKYFEGIDGADEMAQAEELAAVFQKSPQIMAAVEQATQDPEVQAAAQEALAQSETIQEDEDPIGTAYRKRAAKADLGTAAGTGLSISGIISLYTPAVLAAVGKSAMATSVAAVGITGGFGLLALGTLIMLKFHTDAGNDRFKADSPSYRKRTDFSDKEYQKMYNKR